MNRFKIEDAKLVHNGKYDYSLVKYIRCDLKVKIICPEHGIFEQSPIKHINGKRGCPKCGRLNAAKKLSLNRETFIKNAKSIHGDIYDYTLVKYENTSSNVKIICPIHGLFEQNYETHIRKKCGCGKCKGEKISSSKKANIKELIEKANQIHNNFYDYSKVKYKNMHRLVTIICPKHGEFYQNFNNHVLNKCGCPSCGYNVSKTGAAWLDELGIPASFREKHLKINELICFKVDALDIENKIVYEYFGNFWHGNPKYFKSKDKNPKNGIPFGVLYQKTLDKIKIIEDNGYTVIYVWGN